MLPRRRFLLCLCSPRLLNPSTSETPSTRQQVQSGATATEISIWVQSIRLEADGTLKEDLAFRPFRLPKYKLVVELLFELTKEDSLFEALRGLPYSHLKVYRRLDKNKPKEPIEPHESLGIIGEHPELKLPFVIVAIPYQLGK